MTTSNRRRFILSISLLLALYAAHADGAITYVVTNTVPRSHGGKKFAHSLDAVGAKHVMSAATPFIWQTFRQTNSPAGRKHVGRVSLFVDVMNSVAYTSGDEIHVSAGYMSAYKGNVAREITGVIYHEMTHVWQWNGRGQTPGGLIEGVADFVRLKAGYAPSHWVAAGEGDRWDEGYDVTAMFLDYCEGLRSGFVGQLNKKMRNEYKESFFEDLLGKSVQVLWSEYKEKRKP